MPRRESGPAAERRLFLAGSPERGRAELHPDDVEHARRVLRLVVGDAVFGLDGKGHAWRCTVRELGRASVELEVGELVHATPRPGSDGGAEPEITLWVALPKPGPAEEMLDRLVQLGVTRVVPLVTARAGPHARDLSPTRRERLERIVREAMKQSGRLWSPRIEAPEELDKLVEHVRDRKSAFLDPYAKTSFLEWSSAALRGGSKHLSVVVGPEGGLATEECHLLAESGATGCRLGSAILRIETAAEAALAVLAAVGDRSAG